MESNPYATPSVVQYGHSGGMTSEGVIRQLAATKPWVRMFSVLTFIGAGLMVVGGISMLTVGAVTAASAGSSTSRGSAMVGSGAFMAGISIFYFVMAALYIYPGIKLWKYASKIAMLMVSRTEFDLERALNEQRSFWKFAGVSVIVVVALYIIGMIMMFVTMGMAASRIGSP